MITITIALPAKKVLRNFIGTVVPDVALFFDQQANHGFIAVQYEIQICPHIPMHNSSFVSGASR